MWISAFAQAANKPPWPNGQGVGLLIRRLRVRVPQGVRHSIAAALSSGALLLEALAPSLVCQLAKQAQCDSEGIRTPAGRAQWISSPSP
jgi:hypothetical protein